MTPKWYEMKIAAEENYAAAMINKDTDPIAARDYGLRAIELYEALNIQTLEDAAPTRMSFWGIELPDIMHQDVVRERLGIKG